jgi:hypothetical protein
MLLDDSAWDSCITFNVICQHVFPGAIQTLHRHAVIVVEFTQRTALQYFGIRGNKMEKWLFTVESNCADPSKEREFNKWYDTVHLPDLLETPGFVRAMRYENTNPGEGQGKFLAIYEIETDDIAETLAAFTENQNKKAEQGRLSDLIMAVGGGLYRQITAPIARKKR